MVVISHHFGFANASLLAGSMKVMATLLVVGVMDGAHADIMGTGNFRLIFVERLSQVKCLPPGFC